MATQTLSRLDRLTDAQRTRNLHASLFSNLDGLFAFHTSAEDATYLAEELGGTLDAQDLLEMGHYQCYARLTDVRTGERLPTFSVQLEPPPDSDDQLALRLARLSAEHYGRDALDDPPHNNALEWRRAWLACPKTQHVDGNLLDCPDAHNGRTGTVTPTGW